MVTERPPRTSRPESREVHELKQLKISQPELGSAVDMQVALVEMQRRVQARVPLPWIQADPAWVATQRQAGRPLVRFQDIPLEWSDFRLIFRQTADILVRFEALDRPDYDAIVALGREGGALQPVVSEWYDVSPGARDGARTPANAPESLEQVLVLALRPFLTRCAEAVAQRVDLSSW